MKNLNLLFVLIVLSAILINSCSDDQNTEPTYYRYIYYPVSDIDGGSVNELGLKRISTLDYQTESIATNSVVYSTTVAENGIIVFEYQNAEKKLWGKCEDGTLISVPFPESDEEGTHYAYNMPPRIMLARSGHNVAYFTHKVKTGSFDLLDRSLTLILFNCAQGVMSKFPVYPFLVEEFSSLQYNYAAAYGNTILISKDASKVWFVIEAGKVESNQIVAKQYAIVLFSGGTFKVLGNKYQEPIELVAHNEISSTVLFRDGNILKAQSLDGTINNHTLTPANVSNPNSTVTTKSEMVIWTGHGIELVNTENGTFLSKVISFNDIDPNGIYVTDFESNPRLSISGDGGVIVFGLELKNKPEKFSLFQINRDGSGLKKIMDEGALGVPVISIKFELKDGEPLPLSY